MAYTPTYEDAVNAMPAQNTFSNGAYSPTYEDAVGSIASNSAIPNNSFLSQIANSAPVNAILGAGDAVRNTVAGAANLIPGVNVPLAQTGSGISYDVGNIGGNMASFMGGGDVLDALRGIAEGIPLIGKTAQWLGQAGVPMAINKMIGNAVGGAAQSSNNGTIGATEGAGLSGITDLLPGGDFYKSISNQVNPTVAANSIIQSLSGGQPLQNVVNSTLLGIHNIAEDKKNAALDLYNRVFMALPAGNIFKNVVDSSQGVPEAYSLVSALNDLTPNVNRVKNNFIENPTFENAHYLQSQLQSGASKIASSQMNPEKYLQIENLNTARNSVLGSMNRYLEENAPDQIQNYQYATQQYAKNVVPYMATPNMRALARAKGFGIDGDGNPILTALDGNGNSLVPKQSQIVSMQPTSISNLFRNANIQRQASLNTVMSHLPDSLKDNILLSKIATPENIGNPQGLLNSFKGIQDQPYITQNAKSLFSNLERKLTISNAAQTIGSAGIGGALGGVLGAGFGDIGTVLGSSIGAGSGFSYGHPLIDAVANIGHTILPPSARSTIAKSAPYLRNLAISNILNANQNSGVPNGS